MPDFIKPNIVDEEIVLDSNKIIMSKTDKSGIFEFANEYFMQISGYEEHELMGKSMFCVQHPDMPEVIFKMMWEKLLMKENFNVVVKNIAKSGKYYWSVTNFSFKVDEETNEITAIYNRRKKASVASINYFSKLYKTLLSIEGKNGIEASEKYAIGYLESLGFTYFTELMSQFYSGTSFNDGDESNDNSPAPIESISPIFDLKEEDKNQDALSIELDEKPTNVTIKKTKEILPEFITSTLKIPKNETFSTIKNSVNEDAVNVNIEKIEHEIEDSIEELEKNADNFEDDIEGFEENADEFDEENSESKKSFFQKLFGKTEEEIEEEQKRKNK
ncbi:MAG: PAS domain-containing protein [Flavobacteriaceae bacterium]